MRFQIHQTDVTGQEAADHAYIGLEHGDDEIAIEMSGGDHVLDRLLEIVDASEKCQCVERIDERERVVAEHFVDVAARRVFVAVAAFATQRHQLVGWICVCLGLWDYGKSKIKHFN